MIPVNTFNISSEEIELVTQCLKSGWISSEGPYVSQFEESLANLVNRRFAVAMSSGTTALELMLRAAGIGSGDQVILPSFTIISCALAVVRCGAVPVLVDCDPNTWCMDVDQVEAKITAHSRAVMPVHIYGLPVEMNKLTEIAAKYNLLILEDAAQAHGLEYQGRSCGSFGLASVFSFYANKFITTGEGGMVLTDDQGVAERLRSLRNLCFDPNQRFVHTDLGYNARMTAIQAALGLGQVGQLSKTIARKRQIAARYNDLFAKISYLQLPVDASSDARNTYWAYGLVLSDLVPFDAKELAMRLNKLGISTRPFFWPMHQQPVFKRRGLFLDQSYPVSERLARRGLYLPNGLSISDDEQHYVASTIIRILEGSL